MLKFNWLSRVKCRTTSISASSGNAGKVSAQACTAVQQPGLKVTKTGLAKQIIGRKVEYQITARMPDATARHLIQAASLFPLENPGIASVPLGFLAAILGARLKREPSAEANFNELIVRANTGLAAEEPVAL